MCRRGASVLSLISPTRRAYAEHDPRALQPAPRPGRAQSACDGHGSWLTTISRPLLLQLRDRVHRSPSSIIELFTSRDHRGRGSTYLGGLFNLSANSPVRAGQRDSEPLVAPPTQQSLGAQGLVEARSAGFWAVADQADPAPTPRPSSQAGLDSSVERDIVADHDLWFESPL